MFNNIRGILNRRNDPSKSPESLLPRTPSEENDENSASSAEGFLCPSCFLAFPTGIALQNHYESNHNESEISGDGRGAFVCPACKMKLGSEIEFKSHFARHHSGSKEMEEIESMSMQVKALEEGKALLQGELKAVGVQATDLSKENAQVREERDSFKLKANKLIEEGEGANAAMLQLKEENARLQNQFLLQQDMHAQAINDADTKMEDLRTSLKKGNSMLQALNEKYITLEKNLVETQNQVQDLILQKTNLLNEINVQTETLNENESAFKQQVNELTIELGNRTKSLDEKTLELTHLKDQLKKEKASFEKHYEHLEIEKQNFEKRLCELGETLPKVQSELLDKTNKLSEAEKKFHQINEKLKEKDKQITDKQDELNQMYLSYEKASSELENLEKTVADFEVAKVEFCDKISSLNEDLLKKQMKETELVEDLERINKNQIQIQEKCLSLEDENKSLRSSITILQNEKNSLLSEIEKERKALGDLNEVNNANQNKMKELAETCQKEKANANKILKDASVEKDVYLKDKMKLQKQIESLENDCAKQLSQIQETVKLLETQLEEAEEKNAALKSSLFSEKKAIQEIRDKGMHCLSETENGTSSVIYEPSFISENRANELMVILRDTTKWHSKNIIINGQEYPQPRLIAWYGPFPYSYSGSVLDKAEMPAFVFDIKLQVESFLKRHNLNVTYNSVLLNYYRNGKDSVSWHSDDELSMGIDPTIASVSLGETRAFQMRPKQHVENIDPTTIFQVNLVSGSLIIMDGCMQKDWQHQVPKEYHDKMGRINLTFRNVYPINKLPTEVPYIRNKSEEPIYNSRSTQLKPVYDSENFPPLVPDSNKKSNASNKPSSPLKPQNSSHETVRDEIVVDGKSVADSNKNDTSSRNADLVHTNAMNNLPDTKEPSKSEVCLVKEQANEMHTESKASDESNENLKEVLNLKNSLDVDYEEANAGCTLVNKHKLNVNAPDFVPGNTFSEPVHHLPLHKCSSFKDLLESWSNSPDPYESSLDFGLSFLEALKEAQQCNREYFVPRDWPELEVYMKLTAGGQTKENQRVINDRVCCLISIAKQKKIVPKTNRRNGRGYSSRSYHRDS